MEALFVYGTLKQGQANHHWLAGRPVQSAWAPGLVLHQGPGYPFAALGGGVVKGELVLVEPALLRKLDVFEGCPQDYQRVRRSVTLAPGVACQAWVYLASQQPITPQLPSGEWP